MNCVLEGLPVKFGTFLKKKKDHKEKGRDIFGMLTDGPFTV